MVWAWRAPLWTAVETVSGYGGFVRASSRTVGGFKPVYFSVEARKRYKSFNVQS